MEEWKEIKGWPYEVSSEGRVKSVQRVVVSKKFSRLCPGMVLKPILNQRGYLSVNLSYCGKRKMMDVHTLVLVAFVGERPEGKEACHNNGVRSDARLENLRWDTRKNNHADKKLHGTHQSGEKNPSAKLKESDVRRIIQTKGILSNKALAKMYGVSKHTIMNVRRGRTWRGYGQ